MTPERFRDLWKISLYPGDASNAYWSTKLREALTAFVESEAMREKAEHDHAYYRGVYSEEVNDTKFKWTDADWIKASWEKWLGKEP